VTARPQVRLGPNGEVAVTFRGWNRWIVGTAEGSYRTTDGSVANYTPAAVLTEKGAKRLAEAWWPDFADQPVSVQAVRVEGAQWVIRRLLATREATS